MPYGSVLTDSITDSSGGVLAPSSSVFRNRIINGDMRIDQRNAGASGTANAYTVDRWQYFSTQASKATWQRNAASVTPPVGFSNYLGFTSSSAYSVLSTDLFEVYQPVEGLNTADLAWGTAGAATVTLSFWVRSSLTGTFGGGIANATNTRNYPFTYTISAANTWEQKSVTIAGDTSGTWLTTNGIGISVIFGLGAGSTFSATAGAWNGTTSAILPTGATSVVGTNGATFYITGVQLEKGTTATSFDYRPYGTELNLCQRYFEKIGGTTSADIYYIGGGTSGYNFSTTIGMVYKRVAPTVAVVGTWTVVTCNQPSVRSTTEQCITLGSSWTGTTGSGSFASTTSAYLTASAEL